MKAVNLIPGEQRQGAGGLSDLTGRSGGAALIVLGVVVGLAVMIAMYGSAHHSISSQNGEVAQIKAETSVGRSSHRAADALHQLRHDGRSAHRDCGSTRPSALRLVSCPARAWSRAAGRHLAQRAARHCRSRWNNRRRYRSYDSAAAGATPASSTPPGSTPVFTLTGCATSQTVVAQALQRLRLMDGASEVQLQSSTKAETSGASGASGGSGAAGSCSGSDPSFTTQVTFVGLPAAPATGVPTAAGAAAASAAQRRRYRAGLDRRSVQMTTRDRLMLIGIVALAVLLGAWFTTVAPERERAAKISAEVETARQQLASAESAADSAKNAQAQYSSAYASLVSLGQAVPASSETPALIYTLDKATHSRDVNFTSITAGTSWHCQLERRRRRRPRKTRRSVRSRSRSSSTAASWISTSCSTSSKASPCKPPRERCTSTDGC